MDMELDGFDGKYTIDINGVVYSSYSNKILKQPITRKGYRTVVLYKNKVSAHYSVHRLVAKTFLPNPENLPCVNHLDGNKENNILSNLEWCTYKQNTHHARITGLMPTRTGELSSRSKLTSNQVSNIRHLKGSISSYRLGPLYKVHPKTIRDIWNGLNWKTI